LSSKNTIIYEFSRPTCIGISIPKKYLQILIVSTYNMQQLISILAFYRSYILWSFIINIVITIVNPYIVPAIITKLLLTVFLWYFINETSSKRKLTFYKNLGVTPLKLFSTLLFVDILFTISFLTVIKEFI